MATISAVIITKNEDKNIFRCLNSLQGLVDEIIVVDSFSSDGTPQICRAFSGVQFIQTEWRGYGETKNFGNSLAQSDYVLSLDADEELSPELRQEILHLKPHLSGAFALNRLTNYCGTWIHHSSWFPDYQMRLFPRRSGQWNKSIVHEHLIFSETLEVNKLKGLLFHYSITSLEQHILTVNRYTTLAAERLVEAQGSFLLFKAVTRPVFHFLKCYFLRFGFLDGFHGFCIAGISSFYVFLKYIKAFQMKRESGSGLQ